MTRTGHQSRTIDSNVGRGNSARGPTSFAEAFV